MGEKRAYKPRKPGGGRKKLKPEYDAGKNLKEQMESVVALYDAANISAGAERQRHYRAVVALRKNPCEENLWKCVVAFRGYKFKTLSGLPFTYKLKKGKGDEFTKELWVDRREGSKSLVRYGVLGGDVHC